MISLSTACHNAESVKSTGCQESVAPSSHAFITIFRRLMCVAVVVQLPHVMSKGGKDRKTFLHTFSLLLAFVFHAKPYAHAYIHYKLHGMKRSPTIVDLLENRVIAR